MSNTAASNAASSVQRVSAARIGKDHLLYLVLVCSHLPLVVMHLHSLWQRPHYQFFPAVLVVVGVLLWYRWPRDESDYVAAPRTVNWMLALSLLLLTVAVVLVSPFFGYIACLLMTGSLLAHFAGRAFWTQLFSSWVLLWLLIPPPLSLDFELITWLQNFTSKGASFVLDLFGVLHVLAGNVIELPGHTLFVKEACSGIQSLFALMSCAALFVVWMRRSIVPALLLVGSSVFWAGLFNIVRITTVAAAIAWWGIDLSTGWKHELLGIVMFALAIVMLASTDQFIWLISQWSDSLWSTVNDWRKRRRRKRRMISADAGSDVSSKPKTSKLKGKSTETEEVSLPQSAPAPTIRFFLVSGVCGWLMAMQMFVFFASRKPEVKLSEITSKQNQTSALNKSTLPAELNGWKQVDYQTVERDSYSEFGRDSNSWSYESSFCPAVMSFDYPFVGWHELTICYRSQGWNLLNREVEAESSEGAPRHPFVEVELSKPTGEHGYLVFGAFDESGRPVQPPELSFWGRLRSKIVHSPLFELFRDTDVAMAETVGTTYQMQTFVQTDFRLSPEQHEEVRAQFLRFNDAVRSQWERQP